MGVNILLLHHHYPLNINVTQRDQINYLTSQLYEAESGKDDQEGLKEELEWVRPLPEIR